MTIFSLVITTYNRYDTFLKINIPKYLQNPYINEIIISDDCSEDYDKLITNFNDPKIKIFKQSKNLGALCNKITACTYASSEWICLMDSDNFADIDYFEALLAYWEIHGKTIDLIYSPSKALPSFDISDIINKVYTKHDFHTINAWLINLGNHVFNKNIVQYVLPILDTDVNPYALDVKYMIYNWLKNDVKITVIKNMYYSHSLHNESLWCQNSGNSEVFDKSFNWSF